jgi:N-acetylglucosamine-6-phosphate deacetylase
MRIPGFVDLQVNGTKGVDFSSPALSDEAVVYACEQILGNGTAAFLATLVTSPLDAYERNLPMIARVMRRAEFRNRLLGFHLEGPFISRAAGAVGAHDPALARDPDVELLRQMIGWSGGSIRLLTMAAELPGAEELARVAVSQGIVVSVGHSLFDAEDLARLESAGATALTHLGNGLPAMLPRHANPIWPGLASDGLTAMLVADGHHLPPPVLRSFIRAKGVSRTVAVSDASPLAGQPPGRYRYNGQDVALETSGRLHVPSRGCLAGSSATMLQCMNHLASLGLLSLDELLAVGFFNPALLVGMDPAGIPRRTRLRYDEAGALFTVVAPGETGG